MREPGFALGVRLGYCRALGLRRRFPGSRHRRLTAVRKQRKQRDRGNGRDPDQDQVGEMQPAVPARPGFVHVSHFLPQRGGARVHGDTPRTLPLPMPAAPASGVPDY